MKVTVPEPTTKSKSRKVNAYVRVVLAERALRRALDETHERRLEREMRLTGGQLAEARTIYDGAF